MKWDWHEIADTLLDQALPAAAVGIAAYLIGKGVYNRLAQDGLAGPTAQIGAISKAQGTARTEVEQVKEQMRKVLEDLKRKAWGF